jgi:hypothetical protein
MITNNIDQYGRTLYADSVLNRIVTAYPPAKWERQKDGQMGWTYNSRPDCRPDGSAIWYNLGHILLTPPSMELAAKQAEIRAGRKDLKPEMPGFTPAAFCAPKRKAANVQHFTGLLAFDIDAKDNADRLEDYDNLKDEISKIPYVAYCGRSLSGTGFWGLVFAGYHINGHDDYKAAFEQLRRDFLPMGIVIDDAPSNPSSMRYYSFDPEGYFNHFPQPYTRRYIAPPAPKPTAKAYTASITQMGETSQSIFQAFNQQADICAMLEAYGWRNAGRDGEGVRYVRPGKQSGKSAWALPSKNIVHVWTSSTQLESGECYNPAALYTLMEHGGTEKHHFAAAARALKAAGVQ